MTQLKTGDDAPTFHLTDQNGNGWGLGDFKDRFLVLFFYERDGAPESIQELESFRQLHKEFKGLNAKVVGVSPDDPDTHDKIAAKIDLPYNILADTELEASKLFGVLEEDMDRPKPTTFLIGPDGAVLRVYKRTKNHVKKVLADLKGYVAVPEKAEDSR